MTWIIDILIAVARGLGLLPRRRVRQVPSQPKVRPGPPASPQQHFPLASRQRKPPKAQHVDPHRLGYVPPWAQSLDNQEAS